MRVGSVSSGLAAGQWLPLPSTQLGSAQLSRVSPVCLFVCAGQLGQLADACRVCVNKSITDAKCISFVRTRNLNLNFKLAARRGFYGQLCSHLLPDCLSVYQLGGLLLSVRRGQCV